MDLMRIIRSFEEFIYEVMTWLLFYPRTLLKVVRNPLGMLDYAIAEQADPETAYAEALSPPLFLLLTLTVCYVVERAAHVAVPSSPGVLGAVLHSSEGTLILRSLVFAVFPLGFAAEFVRLGAQPLSRLSLRPPFFGQCYVASVFVFSLSFGALAVRLDVPHGGWIASATILSGTAWYLRTNVLWFRRRFGLPWLRATWAVLRTFLVTAALLLAVLTVILMIPA